MSLLPVHAIAQALVATLQSGNRLVLTAPTGSGKSTQVPQILWQAHLDGAFPWFAAQGEIIVLEPRRLATRMVARRVAQEMKNAPGGGEVGQLVGYQTRHESKTSRATRIRFMTEGLFLRLLQDQPHLPGVAVVVMDEFHERSLDADMALGLVKLAQESSRPDLRLVVMSATLDAVAVAAFLGCPPLETHGRAFPVEIRQWPKPTIKPCWELAAEAAALFFAENKPGDVLVFMPGAYEIRKTMEALGTLAAREKCVLHALFGEMSPEAQDAALAPSDKRKIIVATNVAETSITIDGVTCVIDSGLARQARYDPKKDLNTLIVGPISRASADQRAGRAGRTAPGVCLRLWTNGDHAAREAQTLPEVRRVELSPALLQLLDMGLAPRQFPWLDAPAPDMLDKAEKLLENLGATAPSPLPLGPPTTPSASAAGRVPVPAPFTSPGGDLPAGSPAVHSSGLTAIGHQMARFPAHPREARLLVEAAKRHSLGRACVWAALVADRDILQRAEPGILKRFEDPDAPPSDLVVRENALEAARAARFDLRACDGMGVNAQAAREADKSASQFADICRRLGWQVGDAGDTCDLLKCLLVAYPDHIAVKPDAARPDCLMNGRKKVTLSKNSLVRQAGPLVALELQEFGRLGDHRTELALANCVEAPWLEELFPHRCATFTETRWNPERNAAEEVEERRFGELVLSSKTRPKADAESGAAMLVDKLCDGELKLDTWDDELAPWLTRVRTVAGWFPERGLLLYEPDDLRLLYMEAVGEATRFNQIKDKSCLEIFKNALSWEDRAFVEKMAPATLPLPSGHAMKLAYIPASDTRPVSVKGDAKIQQLYGLGQTPTVCGGRVKVLLEILGPNYRPVQVTEDLASFWDNTYPELKKALQRKYPRHEWR